MLREGAIPKLIFLQRCIPRSQQAVDFFEKLDQLHMITWLDILGAPQDILQEDVGGLTAEEITTLTATLDLPPEMGGAGIRSFALSADEAHYGMWGSIMFDLIQFLRGTNIPIYEEMAEAIRTLTTGTSVQIPYGAQLLQVHSDIVDNFGEIGEDEVDLAMKLIHAEHYVDITGVKDYTNPNQLPTPDRLELPAIRSLTEFTAAQCKGEATVIRQCRHVRQAYAVWERHNAPQRSAMLGRAGQAGKDSGNVNKTDMES